MEIALKRAYQFINEEKPEGSYAVLVDRVWPRGISRQGLQLDEWAQHLAPSNELRKWYDHELDKWPEFRRRYQQELVPFHGELEQLRRLAEKQRLILIYGARDTEHNQAVVLREMLQQEREHQRGEA
jgi:uncharacterized protein YeaO (DUF488 family)